MARAIAIYFANGTQTAIRFDGEIFIRHLRLEFPAEYEWFQSWIATGQTVEIAQLPATLQIDSYNLPRVANRRVNLPAKPVLSRF